MLAILRVRGVRGVARAPLELLESGLQPRVACLLQPVCMQPPQRAHERFEGAFIRANFRATHENRG